MGSDDFAAIIYVGVIVEQEKSCGKFPSMGSDDPPPRCQKRENSAKLLKNQGTPGVSLLMDPLQPFSGP